MHNCFGILYLASVLDKKAQATNGGQKVGNGKQEVFNGF